MSGKTKTSILVDKELWEKFKAKVSIEKGLRGLSEAVEEVIREELCEEDIVEWLEEQLARGRPPIRIVPVKPRVRTDAAETLRAMREHRHDGIP